MKVVAVVLCWNSQDYISSCLDSLLAQKLDSINLEVVVVDNDSTDSSVSFVEKKYPQITLIKNPTNMGYAGGNNVGMLYAMEHQADFVWLINPDLTLDHNALHHFLIGAKEEINTGIFSCKIYFAPGSEYHKDRYSKDQIGNVIWFAGGVIDWNNLLAFHRGVDEVDHGQFDHNLEADYVTGACMFIRRKVLDKVGLLDPQYFLYYEENDLCQRARRMGYKTLYLYEPTAWHTNAESTKVGSPLQDYYTTRNRLLFGMKYAPWKTKQALLREAWRLRDTGRTWQKKAVYDFLTRNFGIGSYLPKPENE